MTSAALVLTLGGALAIYLASAHQTWLSRPLPARLARGSGAVLLCAAQWAWLQVMAPLTAVFVMATLLMSWWVAFPYLGALRRIGRG